MQCYFYLIRYETSLNINNIGDNKMGQDKNTFIELRKSEIEMEKAFIKSCDVLIKHAKKWNGKVINSRFANAMDEEINKAVKFFGRNGDF